MVLSGQGLFGALEGLAEAAEPIPGLAERVSRLRAFSRRERRTYALWRTPLLLDLGLSAAGVALLALPVLTASEQVSVGTAALAPLLALARSAAGWLIESIRVTPSGLEALSEGLRAESALGFVALLLLVPASMGLRRVLSRVAGRR